MADTDSGGSGGTPVPSPAPAPGPAGRPPELPPLTGTPLAIGTIALSLAVFMNVLDTSIANVSLPAIAGDLGVSPDQGTWVITSFGVANAISLPLTGWLTRRFGQVKLFMSAVVLFVIASFLCALAPNIGMLILFRVMQGAVAGPMIPLSQSLLLSSYPKAKSGTALGMCRSRPWSRPWWARSSGAGLRTTSRGPGFSTSTYRWASPRVSPPGRSIASGRRRRRKFRSTRSVWG